MSRRSAFRAIVCVAVAVAAFGARIDGARAWQTTFRPGTTRQAPSKLLPLLRHVAARPAKKTALGAKRATTTTPPAVTVAKPAAPLSLLPNDPDWSQQWGLRQVDAPAAWALMRAPARPVVVAVVDSGVDPSHPDLQGALVPGADFADSTGSTVDQYGHGTMVAGVIAARGNNGQGIAGVCWACLIMPVKVLDASGSGTAANVAEGIRFAADHGASVINMSFILSSPEPAVEAAIAYAHERGVLMVAAAGNNGTGNATYPAAYPMVVSVAATDGGDQLYPWSSYGSWVTLAAPGCSLTTVLGGGIANFCGTSAAAPVVAGLAALAYQAGASEATVEATLERTAKPLPGAVGSGRVDALQLVQQLAP